jgi:hypothetical protein
LQGAIGGHQGAIGGLEAARSQAVERLRSQIDAEIETHGRRSASSRPSSRRRPLAPHGNAEAELRREERRARRDRELERKIEAATGRPEDPALEKQIEDIDADERIREIEKRMKPALDALKDAVAPAGELSRFSAPGRRRTRAPREADEAGTSTATSSSASPRRAHGAAA